MNITIKPCISMDMHYKPRLDNLLYKEGVNFTLEVMNKEIFFNRVYNGVVSHSFHELKGRLVDTFYCKSNNAYCSGACELEIKDGFKNFLLSLSRVYAPNFPDIEWWKYKLKGEVLTKDEIISILKKRQNE